MDEYDDEYDNVDDDLDEDFDDFDDDDDDLGDEDDENYEADYEQLMELENLGFMDGQQDGISSSFYMGYGVSVEDLDSLSDEEKNAYETGYYNGFDSSGGKM